MTAEVAILNRGAVALAADSATTVTYYEGGQQQHRYFKGANKIFNISFKFPVGLMIYNAADLQGMPWEVIAKAYREKRGDKPHDTLDGYAKDLFDFIVTDGHLFPASHQEQHLVSQIVDAFLRVCFIIQYRDPNEPPLEPAAKKSTIQTNMETFSKAVNEDKFIDDIDQAFVEKHSTPFFDQVMSAVADAPVFKTLEGNVDPKEIFKTAVNALFKVDFTTLPTTGLVVAGYGEQDYFPKLHHFRCYGVLLGKLLCNHEKTDDVVISHGNVSEIKNFAQAEMVKTFIYGTSMPALQHIDGMFVKSLDGFCDELTKAGHLAQNIDLAPLKTAAKGAFTDGTSAHLMQAHSRPLRDVIGMLPIDELAELAETLISIESLKERVTRPSQSVSGPVDVAVISKIDGFIWIKRKHYFDAKLNPRFISRKGT